MASCVLYVYLFNIWGICIMDQAWNSSPSNEYVYKYEILNAHDKSMKFDNDSFKARFFVDSFKEAGVEAKIKILMDHDPMIVKSLLNTFGDEILKELVKDDECREKIKKLIQGHESGLSEEEVSKIAEEIEKSERESREASDSEDQQPGLLAHRNLQPFDDDDDDQQPVPPPGFQAWLDAHNMKVVRK